jgi:hypothetical protein
MEFSGNQPALKCKRHEDWDMRVRKIIYNSLFVHERGH